MGLGVAVPGYNSLNEVFAMMHATCPMHVRTHVNMHVYTWLYTTHRYVESVLLDPYANAFDYTPSDRWCNQGAWTKVQHPCNTSCSTTRSTT